MSLAAGVVAFAGRLRAAGLSLGPADTLCAMRALTHVDVGVRHDVEAALRCTLCRSITDQAAFDAAFAAFWHAPATAEAGLVAAAPASSQPGLQRVADARPATRRKQDATDRPDRSAGASQDETLRRMDFAAMSDGELAAAKRAVSRLAMPGERVQTRRRRAGKSGAEIDMAATLRRWQRNGGALDDFERRRRRVEQAPLVVLCDISASMQQYAPLLLCFIQALSVTRPRVRTFVFGTRVTDVTKALCTRDPEVAMQAAARAVPDWSGGTRIAEAIHVFNRRWARRVLGQRASVLLLTDGLDRPRAGMGGIDLGEEMARLRRGCKRLIWLNPLLRWHGFAPRAASIAAMLPHVDVFRSAHNLESLEHMAALLSGAEAT